MIANLLLFAPSPEGGGNPIASLVMLAGIFAIFYFLFIRPQRKQQKAHEEMVQHLVKGDEVSTVGGIIGKIIHITDSTVTLKTADDTRIRVERAKVARKVGVESAEG